MVAYYENEALVGAAVRDCEIPREEIFVTSKMWYEDMVEGKQEAAFEKTLKELGLEHVDMYLLHWPINDVKGSFYSLQPFHNHFTFFLAKSNSVCKNIISSFIS